MSKIIVPITISADEYLKLYEGRAKTVFASSITGQSVRFPASILQPFITREGIKGKFSIEFYENNRFKRISRL